MEAVVSNKLNSAPNRKLRWRQVVNILLVAVGLFLCFRLFDSAWRSGASRLFSFIAIIGSRLDAADTAVKLAPGDPEAHYTRGLTLENLNRLNEAAVEIKEATRLRPHYYYQWLDLGITLDRLGDQAGALAAIGESVRLAPAYTQPRWQLGSLLFRQGEYERAFADLRLGARSNPNLYDGVLDLAWIAADGDVAKMEMFAQPETGLNHLAMARFFAKHEKSADAVRHVRAAGQPDDDFGRALLRQTIDQLMASRQFSDAYAAWSATQRSVAGNGKSGPGQVLNGDFTDPIVQNESGFNWKLPASPNLGASIDPSGPSDGSRSICLKFGGDSPPDSQLLSQIVLVQPNTSYSLSFTTKTAELVTGGLPLIVVRDTATSSPLGQSSPISTGSSNWEQNAVEFSTGKDTSAVTVGLQRLSCSQSPCPIFGALWLSKFSLAQK